jgi:hypothetical protein
VARSRQATWKWDRKGWGKKRTRDYIRPKNERISQSLILSDPMEIKSAPEATVYMYNRTVHMEDGY